MYNFCVFKSYTFGLCYFLCMYRIFTCIILIVAQYIPPSEYQARLTFLSMLWIRIDGKLLRSSDDTRLGGIANTRDDRIKIQKGFNSMEQWAGTNKMKFNRDQCRALLLGQVPKFRMRDVGEMPRIFSDSKLKVDQQSDTVLNALHVL